MDRFKFLECFWSCTCHMKWRVFQDSLYLYLADDGKVMGSAELCDTSKWWDWYWHVCKLWVILTAYIYVKWVTFLWQPIQHIYIQPFLIASVSNDKWIESFSFQWLVSMNAKNALIYSSWITWMFIQRHYRLLMYFTDVLNYSIQRMMLLLIEIFKNSGGIIHLNTVFTSITLKEVH